MSDLGLQGQRFKVCRSRAVRSARQPHKLEAAGSNPASATKYAVPSIRHLKT